MQTRGGRAEYEFEERSIQNSEFSRYEINSSWPLAILCNQIKGHSYNIFYWQRFKRDAD